MIDVVLAFDPGNSCGFAVLDADSARVLESGQAEPQDALAHVFDGVRSSAVVRLAIEAPVIVTGRGGFGNAASALKTSWKAGYLYGACTTLWPNCTRWQPNASEWRAVLGLGKGGRKREEIARRVCLWVRATARIDCGDGEKESTSRIDEAMAIALGLAAIDTAKHGRRSA